MPDSHTFLYFVTSDDCPNLPCKVNAIVLRRPLKPIGGSWVAWLLGVHPQQIECEYRFVQEIGNGYGAYFEDDTSIKYYAASDVINCTALRVPLFLSRASGGVKTPVFVSDSKDHQPVCHQVVLKMQINNLGQLPDMQAISRIRKSMAQRYVEASSSSPKRKHTFVSPGQQLLEHAVKILPFEGLVLPFCGRFDSVIAQGVIILGVQSGNNTFRADCYMINDIIDLQPNTPLFCEARWEANNELQCSNVELCVIKNCLSTSKM